MSKPSPRRLATRRRKKSVNARKRAKSNERLQPLETLPRFRLSAEGVDSALAKTVLQTWKSLVLEDGSSLSPCSHRGWISVKEFLALARLDGFRMAVRAFNKFAWQHPGMRNLIRKIISPWIAGQLIFEQLSLRIPSGWFPASIYVVEYGRPIDNEMTFSLQCLDKAKTSGGTVYFAKNTPVVKFGGIDQTVVFSTHAIQRIQERAFGGTPTHASAVATFNLLCNAMRAERCRLPNGQDGVELFVRELSFVASGAGEQSLAVRGPTDSKDEVLVGYCPVQLQRNLAIATTFLLPGMRGTPRAEYFGQQFPTISLAAPIGT